MTKMAIDLTKGQDYIVELYPKEDTVKAKYLGKNKLEGGGDQHLFVYGHNGEKSYIALDDHWIEQNETGVVTHMEHSSFGVLILEKKDLEKKINSEEIQDRDLALRIFKFLDLFGEKISR